MIENSNNEESDLTPPAASQVSIRCKGLWKIFGNPGFSLNQHLRSGSTAEQIETLLPEGTVAAVKDATFTIQSGEVFVIMGLSGSGKSTLVRCLSRLIEPTVGSLEIQGTDLLAAGNKELRKIRRETMSMVFQHFALLPNRDVLGNVAFPLQVQGINRQEREQRAREMIELVGLSGKVNQYPSELSGGQQQRVGIARSLTTNPAIWLLDEPFSALDPLIRTDLQDELLRLQAKLNKTIVFITHDLDEAIKIADRIAIMDQGAIVQIGTPEQLVLNPANDYVARFTQGVPLGKVTSIATIMRSIKEQTPLDEKNNIANTLRVKPHFTVQEVATLVANSDEYANQAVLVEDTIGRIVGYVEPAQLLQVLSGVHSRHAKK